jgi:hypothetical protein
MASLVRAIVCLLVLAAPVSAEAADVTSWQGWAFELRGDGLVGWVGAWTPGGCEVQRLEALEAKLDASIGACHPVTLTDEPTGLQVWAVMRAEDGFVAASSPAICEPENAPDHGMRPVSLADRCQPLWLQVPS